MRRAVSLETFACGRLWSQWAWKYISGDWRYGSRDRFQCALCMIFSRRALARIDLALANVSASRHAVCTCSPLTIALRSTRCCTVRRGPRAPSLPSRPRYRAAPRLPEREYHRFFCPRCSPAGRFWSLSGCLELRGGQTLLRCGSAARRLPSGDLGGPPTRLRRLWWRRATRQGRQQQIDWRQKSRNVSSRFFLVCLCS